MLFVFNSLHDYLEGYHGTFLRIRNYNKGCFSNHKGLMVHAIEACRIAIQSGWLSDGCDRLEEFETFVELSENETNFGSSSSEKSFLWNIQELWLTLWLHVLPKAHPP
jgi:hypothetical protein